MPRRANGDGCIRRLKDGRFEAAIRIAGRRYWLKGRTEYEVRGKLNEIRRQYHVGTLIPPKRLTLAQFLDDWLAAGAADWKPKTLHGYRSIVERYWKPALGHVQLQKLTPALLAACYQRWRSSRTGGTLLNVHRCLHRALVVAVRWGLLARNIADSLEPPRAQRQPPQLWTPEQAAQFLALTRGDRWHPLWAVLLGTGCRLGEALGLRWRDVDLRAGTLTIRETVTWVGVQAVTGPPKTRSGLRVVSLPSFAVAALREQPQPRDPTTHIFTRPDGHPLAPWHVRNAFVRACERARLPVIRRHALRHLAASVLLAEGLPLPAVAQQLGHASPAVTAAVYSHQLRQSDPRAAQALERALGQEHQDLLR